MNIKLKLAVAIATAVVPASAMAESLDSFIHTSIANNNKVKSLAIDVDTAKLGISKSDLYYLPTVTAVTTASETFKKQKTGKIDFKKNREFNEQLNANALIWSDNVTGRRGVAKNQYNASMLDLAVQSQNISAQITTTAYAIRVYENLIKTGEDVLKKAHSIKKGIGRKVNGGLAKKSDLTTANVLLVEMENAILATKMKINQLKLTLEQVSGMSYPKNLVINDGDIEKLITDHVTTDVKNNINLRKKAIEKNISRGNVSNATNFINISVQAKTKYDMSKSVFDGKDSQIGLNVTLNLFDPSSYWKKKVAANKLSSASLEYDQLFNDLKIKVLSQESILKANNALMASERNSVAIKQKLIKQRQNEYEINVTSLYELIQSWNSYYSSMQQMSDTKVTLINTIMSIKTATGKVGY